jgi:hypothetical protein
MRGCGGREATLTVVFLVAFAVIADLSVAQAQGKQERAPARAAPQKQAFPERQMPLTEKQILGAIAASKEIGEITDVALGHIRELDPQTAAKVEATVRKNGLANYDEYKNVWDNITLVLIGFDLVTNRYVGREAATKAEMARVRTNKEMSADNKKEELTKLRESLGSWPAIQYKANINLVAKYFDAIVGSMPGGED